MSEEKGNFRGKVFGGFNRRDVISYIEAAAKRLSSTEKARDAYEEEAAVLKEKNERLAELMDEYKAEYEAQIKEYEAHIEDLEGKLSESDRLHEEEIEKLMESNDEQFRKAEERHDEEIHRLRMENASILSDIEKERQRAFNRKNEDLKAAQEALDGLLRRTAELKEDIDQSVSVSRRRVEADFESVSRIVEELDSRLRKLREMTAREEAQ